MAPPERDRGGDEEMDVPVVELERDGREGEEQERAPPTEPDEGPDE